MTENYIKKVAPLIKDKVSWDAFMCLLDHEQDRICGKLIGMMNSDELQRLSAQYTLINRFKNLRTVILDMEKNLNGTN